MTEEEVLESEQLNTGTSWTRNEDFDKFGYFPVERLWVPEELYTPLPKVRGNMVWWGKRMDQFYYEKTEGQVKGSLSRYYFPLYKYIHTGIRRKIEKIIGRKLYNTYYYDRFYLPGHGLKLHTDRDACEISVTMHVSSNCKNLWPFWVKTVSGEKHSIQLQEGDAIIYKGCERPHWREPLPREYEKKWFRTVEKEDLYYHQVFFHYVLADGERSHCAYDMSR